MLRSQKRALAAAIVAAALALPGSAAAQRVPIGFEDVSVVEGLVAPTSLTVGPDGRIYVTEQSGRAVIVEDGEILPAAFLEVPVNPEGERGLMSLTFDRDFRQNGYVYAYYTRADAPFNRLSRFRIDPRRPDRVDGSETVLLDGVRASKFHNGGAVVARRRDRPHRDRRWKHSYPTAPPPDRTAPRSRSGPAPNPESVHCVFAVGSRREALPNSSGSHGSAPAIPVSDWTTAGAKFAARFRRECSRRIRFRRFRRRHGRPGRQGKREDGAHAN